MLIIATTKSGTKYSFAQDEQGELRVTRELMKGKVTKFYNPIENGRSMEFDFISDEDASQMHHQSLEIVKLTIAL